ncbi:MAG TPA: hypothetical protein VF781_09310 [Solirubrobacteraceae bacterium]
MSNQTVTYLVAACAGVLCLGAFGTLVLAPAVTAYRRPLERLAAVVLSLYVLAAMVGLGGLLGAVVILEWPRLF